MNKIYETDRLYVRPFVREDIEGNYKKWWMDQEVTRHNSHGLFPYTKSQMDAFLSKLESSDDIVWAVIAKLRAVCAKKNNIILAPCHIGNISLTNINWVNKSAEFSCIFGEKKYWGRGFCTEAAKLLFEHGFKKLNLHRIWTGTAKTNIGMIKVAEKLGMELDGIFKDGVFLNGKYEDVLSFGLLQNETYSNQKEEKENNSALDSIQDIRSKNNVNWMNIMKLAFEKAPVEAKSIMEKITESDKEISKLCEELIK